MSDGNAKVHPRLMDALLQRAGLHILANIWVDHNGVTRLFDLDEAEPPYFWLGAEA